MASSNAALSLYSLTLQTPTCITHAFAGNFSGSRAQELLLVRSTRIELWTVDKDTGKMSVMLGQDVIGQVRAATSFRLTGSSKDLIIIGSDSGRLVVLEYDPVKNSFGNLHTATYGKSGSRRVVPGQMLATDPKGRSCLISALDKAKLVYVLNRDAEANLTISSPLEAHKANAIITAVCGVDVGFDNPLYAALETSYEESDLDHTGVAMENSEKMLTFYELDLGLNHVVRKWSEPTDRQANLLVQVPGGKNSVTDLWDGPSGVLICTENYIIYRSISAQSPEHRLPIPRRRHPLGSREGVIIISAVMHKMKGNFFFLLQSEEGDMFKLTIAHTEGNIDSMTIKYFDTVPPASSLCILKAGFLFVACEYGDHYMYNFQKLGDDDEETEFTSSDYADNGVPSIQNPNPIHPAYFTPRPLENIVQVDVLDSFAPIVDAKVVNKLGGDSPQIFVACGKGSRSTFRTLRHGLEVQEAVNSPLPEPPNAVWSTKLREDDEFDRYIVLSFQRATLVLAVGDTIEEVSESESRFLYSSPTIAVQQLGKASLLQVHPAGIRHVLENKTVNEWRVPPRTSIITAATNRRQVIVALSNGEIVYFELDESGELAEYQERKQMGAGVLALSVGDVPEGRMRSPYLAVGCDNQTVHIVSLDLESTLETISLQALAASPSAIAIVEMIDSSIDKTHSTLFINIGLVNGVLLRTILDSTTGRLTDTRTRFLGTRPVSLTKVTIGGSPSLLALSSRAWLNYTYQNLLQFTPLIHETIDYAWSFSAALCPEGLIGISGSTLKIFTIPKLGSKLKQDIVQLSYTPRKVIEHPYNHFFYIAESDNRTLCPSAQAMKLAKLKENGVEFDRAVLDLPTTQFGHVQAAAGNWASCVRIIDPYTSSSVLSMQLDNNDAALSLAIIQFESMNGESVLCVGGGKDMKLMPRSFASGFILVYRLSEDGSATEFLHRTEIEEPVSALASYNGKLVAGVGKFLRVYDLGKRKLLRKCELRDIPNLIVSIEIKDDRIVVGDVQDSIFFCVYKSLENKLMVFSDDSTARWIASFASVDHDTVAVGDKFGNLAFVRMDSALSERVDEDSTGASILSEKPFLMGCAHKVSTLAHTNLGDIPTSLQHVSMVPGGDKVILYTGIQGSIGIVTPFKSRTDIDFISTLEIHLRDENLSLIGRSHLSYRSMYAPAKACVDGDLCERFALLSAQKQLQIAGELDRTVSEVLKKLEQLRVTASGF